MEQKFVSFVCVYMVAKMEESYHKIPFIATILSYFGDCFEKEQFENCERNIFKLFNYNLCIKNPMYFLHNYLIQSWISN